MSNNGWELNLKYDHRFAALLVQTKHGSEVSPPYNISIRDVIKSMPRHEVMACMQMADNPELNNDIEGIERYRRAAIINTDLKGKVVLDVGGYDGWAAKLALDNGAARAICLDNQQYHHYGWEDKKLEGVEYITGDGLVWTWPVDVLINYNLIYHLKNPWAFLDKCREIIKPDGEMLLCTLFRYHDGSWAYLYEPKECNPTDCTVYWGFSLTALERLLTYTGWDFEQEGLAYDRVVYRCSPTAGWQRKHEDT